MIKTLNLLFIGAVIGVIIMGFTYTMSTKEEPQGITVDTVYKDRMTLNEENVMYWLIELDVREPDIVLNQSRHETGNFKSRKCLELNNLFGFQYSASKPLKFSHWLQSIIYYKQWQDEYYNPDDYTDYYQFLEQYKYAEDEFYIMKLKQY